MPFDLVKPFFSMFLTSYSTCKFINLTDNLICQSNFSCYFLLISLTYSKKYQILKITERSFAKIKSYDCDSFESKKKWNLNVWEAWKVKRLYFSSSEEDNVKRQKIRNININLKLRAVIVVLSVIKRQHYAWQKNYSNNQKSNFLHLLF